MSAGKLLAANKVNADTAGYTGSETRGAAAESEGMPAAPAPLEAMKTGIGDLLSGGIHPEHVAAMIDHGLERATDSVKGRLGGIRPAFGSVAAPGPGGSVAAARQILRDAIERATTIFKS